MSVRFKFRSSVGFDSVDLGGRPSIPVRDLRVKILEQKNLQICRDFDLVISDAVTGEAYENEDFPIREGSSVIIKRVPKTSMFDEAIGNSITNRTVFLDALVPPPSENVKIEDFDDFGNDFYPALGVSSLDSDIDVVNTNNNERGKNGDVLSSETSFLKCQNLERSNLSEDMSKGNTGENCDINCTVKEDTKRTMSKDKMKQNKYFEGDADMASPMLLTADLPTELRCSLCYTIFKDAVMIPCCQHSFCEKCIRLALVERECCPKCSSKKCTIEDLLPNLSLRQAIEHFLDAPKPLSVSDKVLPNYVPDGESGIRAKEVSCAMSIGQKEQLSPDSPSATCKGSNQIMAESACESLMRNRVQNTGTASHIIRLDTKKALKTTASLDRTVLRKDDMNIAKEDLKHVADLQGGGSSLKVSQNPLQKEEATLAAKKKKGPSGITADGNAPNKHKKGDRNCYMCGSPDHLVRDCPAASAPYQMLQTGDAGFHGGMPVYGPPYWQGNSFPHPRPYANIYGLPFDPTMVPITPYGIPPYMPSFYAGLPLSCGIMRMGGVAQTMVPGSDRPLSRAEFMELQDSEWRRKSFNEHLEREQTYYGDDLVDEDHYNDPRGSHDHKPQLKKDIDRSYSGDDGPRLHKKHPRNKHSYSQSHQRPDVKSEEEENCSVDWKYEKRRHLSVSSRDQRSCYSEKSNSKIQDLSDGSIQHDRERTQHLLRTSSKRHNERRGPCGSDGSRRSHHRSRNETSTDKEKVKSHKKHGRKHHNHSESALEPDSSNDRRQHLKEKESRHTSRHSRHKGKSSGDQLGNDRWEMVDCMDDDHNNEYHCHKRKRTHYT